LQALVLLVFCCSYSSADPPINELTISDDGYAEVPLDFDFPFFGNTYTKSWMYTNGVVGFLNPSALSGTPRHMCCNGLDLNNLNTTNLATRPIDYFIMPLWTDIKNYAGKLKEQGDSTFQKYIWEDIAEYAQTNRKNSFDLTIKPDGGIMANYHNLDIANHSVTIGVTGDVSEGEKYQFLYHNRNTDGDLSFTYNSNVDNPSWMPERNSFYYLDSNDNLYTVNPCTNNPLYASYCTGYAEAYALQLYNQQCTANPLYDSGCPGYASAYLTQQCNANSLYSESCPNYATAYFNQQCSLDPLYHSEWDGYATAYFNQQCGLNPLYNTECTGYETAYFNQQCTLDPLYNSECTGYDAAYLTQQCNISPLYSSECNGYASAYLLQQCNLDIFYSTQCDGYEVAYFNQQCSLNTLYDEECTGYDIAYLSQQCAINPQYDTTCPGYEEPVDETLPPEVPVIETIVVTPIVPTLPEIPVMIEPEIEIVEIEEIPEVEIEEEIIQEIEIAQVEDETSQEEISVPEVSEDESETKDVQEVANETEEKDEVQESDKVSDDEVGEKNDGKSSDKSEGDDKSSDKPRPKKIDKKEKMKKLIAKKASQLAEDMGKAATLEMQKKEQGKLVALIGYVPDFDKYKNSQVQKEITFYKPIDNVDNAFARWFLNDPKFTELEELQYPNGFK